MSHNLNTNTDSDDEGPTIVNPYNFNNCLLKPTDINNLLNQYDVDLKISDLNKPYGGLGISILSTPKGVMSDHQAKKNNVGGEILCEVF